MDRFLQALSAWDVWLYYLPMMACIYGYLIRDSIAIARDLRRRRDQSHYRPELHVGDVCRHLWLSVCPLVNWFALAFSVAPEVTYRVFGHIGRVMAVPLVPPLSAEGAIDAQEFEETRSL